MKKKDDKSNKNKNVDKNDVHISDNNKTDFVFVLLNVNKCFSFIFQKAFSKLKKSYVYSTVLRL